MCRGQCASVMTGLRNGVSSTISKDESRAYCYGHSLNLAMNDTVKKRVN